MFRIFLFIGILTIFFPFLTLGQTCIVIDQQPESQLILDNDDVVLIVNVTSTENLTYQWQIFDTDSNINDWVNISDDLDYSGTSTNTLTITNVTEAIDNSRFRIQISGQTCSEISDEAIINYSIITVNNMFTPNDDGFNDTFNISGLNPFPEAKLQIYNRWGNLVYEKINYKNDWDGVATTDFTINGSKKVPTGTYFYTIDLNYDGKKYSGWLYINR